MFRNDLIFVVVGNCCNLTLRECEDDIHTPEMGTWESFRTPENSEFDCRGLGLRSWSLDVQTDLAWAIRTSVTQVMCERKAGSQTSNWPLKVGNRPDPSACRQSAAHRWKTLKETYKFALHLIPIRGLSKKLRATKVPGVQIGTVLGQFRDSYLGILGQTAIWMWSLWNGIEYIIWGKVVASPESEP